MNRLLSSALLLAVLPGCFLAPIVGGDCLPGYAACDGRCIDVRQDVDNCGSCGNACGANQICSAGRCLDGDDGDCDPPAVWCDGAGCADLDTDPANCGACGAPCAEGEPCTNGECAGPCGEGTIDCGGACVDVATDAGNCGACGVACGERDLCVAGRCETCAGELTPCGQECVDLGGDRDHCGACGNACEALDVCTAGSCALPCPDGLLDCRSGRCVNPAGDPDNCGACGVACGDGESCLGGQCVYDCGEGLIACERQCVVLSSDPDHCGACGAVCDTGICEDGHCRRGDIGHLVLIGHDYARSRRDQGRLVANAVLIPEGAVQVVEFAQYADPIAVGHVEEAIAADASDSGRSVSYELLEDPQLLDAPLLDANVLLLYAQGTADAAVLDAIGELWAPALASFLARGGVIVALDEATVAPSGSTHRILVEAGLVVIDGIADVSGSEVLVTGAGDVVASGMAASYRAEDASAAFTTDEDNAVVTSGDAVVVLHKIFLP